MKLLLVDDDSFLRDMYATKFVEKGHEVDSVASGDLAVEYLTTHTVDAVLMDMVMPGMTGIELLSKIRASNIGGNPKCLVLSNQSEESDRAAALAAGAAGYIVKAEMIPSEVVARVESLIS